MSEQQLVLPTPEQLEWADCEVGVLIHYDIPVFEPSYEFREQWGYHPDPAIFNPAQLDTDQWLETAQAAGARYAVLVAKHCSGFCLWPTQAHDYSVRSTPWRNGQGDMVGDFIRSCAKYGLKPGLYYSASCNAYCNVDNPGRMRSGDPAEQQRYNTIVLQQLTELWTRYDKLFEIWFDGGVLPPAQGGPDIASLLHQLQPQAVVFQGPAGTRSLIRWVSNERGVAPYPCWSTTHMGGEDDAEFPQYGPGDPDGSIWAPAESDVPNRKRRWFWQANEEQYLYSLEEMLDLYDCSVGRNTNLLFGMVIDDRGLVPDADVAQFRAFGETIARRFSNMLGETSGQGEQVLLDLGRPALVDHVILQEDITQGERVRAYVLEALPEAGQDWRELDRGTCIGHKRIHQIEPMVLRALRLRCTQQIATPQIRKLAAYHVM